MNELIQFNYGEAQVRTITKDGEPWFVAKDVCEYFGDTNYRRSLSRLDDDQKGVSQISTPGGQQSMTVVNEPGLYSLLLRMRPQKGNATSEIIARRIEKLERFERWLYEEVLPTIRKTGGMYLSAAKAEELLDNPDLIIALAQQVLETSAKRETQKLKMEYSEVAMEPEAW